MAASGYFIHSLDEKNRFKIPSKLLESMGTELHLMKSTDPDAQCIYVYSEEQWNKLCADVASKISNNAEGRRKSRKLISRTVCGDIDKNGKFTLNAGLKEYAGIKDEVCIVCGLNHTEFWAPEIWQSEDESLDDVSLDDLDIAF